MDFDDREIKYVIRCNSWIANLVNSIFPDQVELKGYGFDTIDKIIKDELGFLMKDIIKLFEYIKVDIFIISTFIISYGDVRIQINRGTDKIIEMKKKIFDHYLIHLCSDYGDRVLLALAKSFEDRTEVKYILQLIFKHNIDAVVDFIMSFRIADISDRDKTFWDIMKGLTLKKKRSLLRDL